MKRSNLAWYLAFPSCGVEFATRRQFVSASFSQNYGPLLQGKNEKQLKKKKRKSRGNYPFKRLWRKISFVLSAK